MENRALGGHIISFSAGNTLFCRKRPRPDLSGEALAAPSPACVRSVVPRVAPFGSHIVPFSSHIVPPGSFVVPLGSRMIPPRPHAGTTATPLSRCPHHPLLFSRRSGNHSFRPAEPPRRPEQKNRLFFGVFVKFLLLLQHIVVTTLYPRRNGLHAASASLLTRGIPMTGDVPAAGSEQHTETTYLW